MRTLLVTGGTGHVGKHFVPLLEDPVLLGRSETCHLRADLADPASLDRHDLGGFETLVHAAHPMVGARPEADEAPGLVEASAVALVGLLGRLPALRRIVLVSSTAAEFPGDVYGVTKRLEEDLMHVHAGVRGVSLCVLRISAVYGPRATVERALARFLRAAMAGELPVVKGGGGSGTDYVHVEDAARAIALAVECGAEGTLHVTGNEAATPEAAALLALRAAGRDGEPEVVDGPPAGGVGPIPNDDARRALVWDPRYDLSAGMRDYAAWLSDNPR